MADMLDADPARGPGIDLTVWFLALLCRVQISLMPAGAGKDRALAIHGKLMDILQRPPGVP